MSATVASLRYLLGVMRRHPIDSAVACAMFAVGFASNTYVISMAVCFVVNLMVAHDLGRGANQPRYGRALGIATSYGIACAAGALVCSNFYIAQPSPARGILLGFMTGIALAWFGVIYALTDATCYRITRLVRLGDEVERVLAERRAQRRLDEEDAMYYGEVRSCAADFRFDRARYFAKRLHCEDLRKSAQMHIDRAEAQHKAKQEVEL